LANRAPKAADWAEWLGLERPTAVEFWYRAIPLPAKLMPANIKGRITWDDPPLVLPGTVQLRLDPSGRLHELMAMPLGAGTDPPLSAPSSREMAPPPMEPPWASLFRAADLPMASYEAVPPVRVPATFADARAAWIGSYPEPPFMPIRIEAAAHLGRPVAFHIIEQRGPHDAPAAGHSTPRTWRFLARIALVGAAVVLAARSLVRQRGDALGAFQLGLAIFATVVAFTVFAGSHPGDPVRLGNLLVKGVMHGLVVAAEFALYYLALEPYLRRIYPEAMISWSRLVRERFDDPLIGRHVLIGLLLGVVIALLNYLRILIPRWTGGPEGAPVMFHPSAIDALSGAGSALGACLEVAVDLARNGMVFFVSLVMLRVLLRSGAAAAAAAVVIWTAVWSEGAMPTAAFPWLPPGWIANALIACAVTVFALRTSLLATVIGFISFGTFSSFPLQLGEDVWYGEATAVVLLLLAIAVVFGLHAATRSALAR
jgi:hypothetical protein